MKGIELQEYMKNLNLFKIEPVYIVEIEDEYISNMVPALYQVYLGSGNGLKIMIKYHTNKEKYVDFTWGGRNLYASHKLKDMTLLILCDELNKFLSKNEKFTTWMNRELRDWKIENLVDNEV
jgi:hypothetical protein